MNIAIIYAYEQDMRLDIALSHRTAFNSVYVKKKTCNFRLNDFLFIRKEIYNTRKGRKYTEELVYEAMEYALINRCI